MRTRVTALTRTMVDQTVWPSLVALFCIWNTPWHEVCSIYLLQCLLLPWWFPWFAYFFPAQISACAYKRIGLKNRDFSISCQSVLKARVPVDRIGYMAHGMRNQSYIFLLSSNGLLLKYQGKVYRMKDTIFCLCIFLRTCLCADILLLSAAHFLTFSENVSAQSV